MAKNKRKPQKVRVAKNEKLPVQQVAQSESTEKNQGDSLLKILLMVCCGLLFARMLIPAESSERGDTILFVFCWLMLFSLTCWLAMRRRFATSFSFDLIDISLFMIAVLGPLLSWSALYFRGGNLRAGTYGLWEWLGTFLTVFMIRKLIRSTNSLLPVILFLGIIIPLSSLGYYQHYISYPQKRELVNPIAEKWNQLEHQISNASPSAKPVLMMKQYAMQREMTNNGIPLDARTRAMLLNRLNTSSEPTARFALANTLGGVLACGTVLLLILFSSSQKTGNNRLLKSGLISLICLLVIGALVLTKSRTAWIGLVVGLLLLSLVNSSLISRAQRKRNAIGFIVILFMIAGLTFTGALDIEIITEAKKSFQYRIEYWQASAMMLQDHFLFGVGPGNFREMYLQYKLPESSEVILDPHNIWLDAWSQGGIVSVVGLCLLFVPLLPFLFKQFISKKNEPNEKDTGPLLPSQKVIALGSVLVILFAGLFSSVEIALPVEELFFWGITIIASAISLRWLIDSSQRAYPLTVCAAVALFVHLHGAGGYSMPIIVQLLLIFATINLPAASLMKIPCRVLFPAGLGIGLLLAALCWFSAVKPKLDQTVAKAEMFSSRSPAQSERILKNWAKQDRISPEPWRQLASLYVQNAKLTKNKTDYEQAIVAIKNSIKRDPFNYHGYREQAKLYKLMYHRTKTSKFLKLAIESQNFSIRRYPNDSRLHLELALLFSLHRDQKKSHIAATKAQQLNEINQKLGHSDRVFNNDEQTSLAEILAVPEKKINKTD